MNPILRWVNYPEILEIEGEDLSEELVALMTRASLPNKLSGLLQQKSY